MHSLARVVLLGRTNVGKSTLFNRLTEKRKALTSPQSHTTRNINADIVHWQGVRFELIDTGGIETIIPKRKQKRALKEKNRSFEIDIIKQTQKQLTSADLIAFVVDTKDGLLPQDIELAKYVQRHFKQTPVVVVANKADSRRQDIKIPEIYGLGLGEPLPVSAASGKGTGDLLDVIVSALPPQKVAASREDHAVTDIVSVAIIGRPNVGKSSLLNALMGEEAVIVSDIAGTTRESYDTLLTYGDTTYCFIDTAGLRKRAKTRSQDLEKISVEKTLETARKAAVSLLLIDVSKPITSQDQHLAQMLIEQRSGIVIVANKWDLIPDKTTKTQKGLETYIYTHFPFLTWAPVVFLSAKTTKGVKKIYEYIDMVETSRHIEISENALGKFLKQSIKKHRPTSAKGTRPPHLSRFVQVQSNPPVFQLTARSTDTINPTYLRYLENQLREKFSIVGTPLTIRIKK